MRRSNRGHNVSPREHGSGIAHMKRLIFSLCVFCIAACAPAKMPSAGNVLPVVVVTVNPAPNQTFAGFGTSLTNTDDDFQKLTPAVRESISNMVWHDLNFKILRLWFNPTVYLANPNKPDLSEFRRKYVESGIISLAMKQGCTTLLLAPNDVPPQFGRPKSKLHPDYAEFTDAGVTAYAQVIAQAIRQIRDETGIQINATGVLNEPNDRPVRFTEAQWPVIVKALRAQLDSRGLTNVSIIGPEASSCDDTAFQMVDAIKKDPEAWAALKGISTHTYNMGATDTVVRRIAGSNKSYWQTESSTPGPENLGDTVKAASSAARILSDLNHGVTHWIWFIGYEQQDAADNGTRLIRFDASKATGVPAKLYKYFYIQQLSSAFPPGSVAHQCTSSTEGSMTWTYGTKPNVLCAAAQRADGSWAIGLINYTSKQFADPHLSSWERSQSGQNAKTLTVTVKIPALANAGSTTFYVHSSDESKPNVDAGRVVAKNGVLTVTLTPLQMLTLSTK